MNALYKILLSFLLLTTTHVIQAIPSSTYRESSLDRALEVLLSYEEAKTLWDRVNREGPIQVVGFNNADPFEAYWEGSTRKICVNLIECPTLEKQITAILFELHNAKANGSLKQFHEKAFWNQIGQEEFAMGMEQIEWRNVNEAHILLQKGIKKGFYPTNCFLPYFPSFKEYLDMQERYSHTDHHRDSYWILQGQNPSR